MLIEQTARSTPLTDYTSALLPDRRWERIILMAAGAPRDDAVAAARALARRDGARLIIYDAAAVSWSGSPYPPEADVRLPDLLGEGAMQRVGRDDLASLARALDEEALLGGIYLSPRTDAADLSDLVQREHIDLVISLLPSGDKRLRHVQRARRYAHVMLAPPGEAPRLLPPVDPADDLPEPEGVRWFYLLVVFVTFVLARRRNAP